MQLMPGLPHQHEHPSIGHLLLQMVLIHLPNFWAKLWKYVLCNCALNMSGRGVTTDFLLRVGWHFTINMCKNHTTLCISVSGQGSLGIHCGFLPSLFSFLIAVVGTQNARRAFWLANVQSRNPLTMKEHNWRCERLYKNQWMNVGKMLKETDL